jgi:hypothetical protein
VPIVIETSAQFRCCNTTAAPDSLCASDTVLQPLKCPNCRLATIREDKSPLSRATALGPRVCDYGSCFELLGQRFSPRVHQISNTNCWATLYGFVVIENSFTHFSKCVFDNMRALELIQMMISTRIVPIVSRRTAKFLVQLQIHHFFVIAQSFSGFEVCFLSHLSPIAIQSPTVQEREREHVSENT